MRSYAVQWLGSLPDRHAVADRVSPLTYVRSGIPPVLTIHGDADPTVPYTHAVRLREALDRAGVPNRLHTVPGGGHGNFSVEQYQQVYETVRQFLGEHVTK
jgi:dipeptidyl aminopeptidase/acylaminoacyl peptidase